MGGSNGIDGGWLGRPVRGGGAAATLTKPPCMPGQGHHGCPLPGRRRPNIPAQSTNPMRALVGSGRWVEEWVVAPGLAGLTLQSIRPPAGPSPCHARASASGRLLSSWHSAAPQQWPASGMLSNTVASNQGRDFGKGQWIVMGLGGWSWQGRAGHGMPSATRAPHPSQALCQLERIPFFA